MSGWFQLCLELRGPVFVGVGVVGVVGVVVVGGCVR